jgi:hypothetical protein
MALNEATVSAIAEKLGLPEVLTQFQSTETPEDGVNPFADALTPLQVFQEKQLTERLSNERAAAAEEARKTAVGNTYGAMDKRILAETGVAKNDNESTVDYMARAAKEKFGTKSDESEEMKLLRDEVKTTRELLVTRNGELEQMKVTHASETKTLQINSKLDNAIDKLALVVPATITKDEDIQAYVDSQQEFFKFKFMQKYEGDLVNGKVVFKDKATGKVETDSITGSPLTEAALVAKFAPSVVSVKATSQKSGAGVKAADNLNNQGPDNFGDFASLDDYKKHLTQSGVTLTSKAGQEKITAYIKARDKK